MHSYSEQRRLPHPAEDLYGIITDVDQYAEFLPWCVASRVRERRNGTMIADLVIGYGGIRESFTSRVELDPVGRQVSTTQESGPFKHLKSTWTLSPDGERSTLVDFEISFEFRSILLEKLIGAIFERAARKMVAAFEDRAATLLG